MAFTFETTLYRNLGTRVSKTTDLTAANLVAGFTAPSGTANAATVASLAAFNDAGYILTALSGEEPIKQTRDGLAVLRGDGTKVMRLTTGTLPGTPAFSVALRIWFPAADPTMDVATSHILSGFNDGGDDVASVTAQTTVVTASSLTRQFFRLAYGADEDEGSETATLLDGRDFLDFEDQWASVIYTKATDGVWLTWEGGGHSRTTFVASDTLTVTNNDFFLFSRSGTASANLDIRHAWIFSGNVHSDPDDVKTIALALRT